MTGTENTTTLRRLAVALTASTLVCVPFGTSTTSDPGIVREGQGQVEAEEHEVRAPTEVELTPSVEAAFPRESFAPGTTATLVISNRARGLTLQVFRVGPEGGPTIGNITMNGVAVTPKVAVGSSPARRAVRVGDWPSGLYFARLHAADGRVGFAPFVVRPRRLGERRVAVVLPTLTWQAYNLRDDDGDGNGDTWYASWDKRIVGLGRPYMNRGVPNYFRRYDLPFLKWLARTGREADILAQSDIERAPSAASLAAAYDLIVFPGHHEYVTTREYDLIEGYRDLGGNLMFLSANNFFWQVVRRGNTITKTKPWRYLGRSEAALLGVQYRGNDSGESRASWTVTGAPATSWVFAGTKLGPGSKFGDDWGIEIDRTADTSPDDVQVLAEIPDLFGPGFTAQMTYYETDLGARVFAAGAFSMAGQIDKPQVARVVANVWRKLSDTRLERLPR